MNQTYNITIALLFSLIFLFGATIEDRCSRASTNHWYNLTECPSSENFNLLECYDAFDKNYTDDLCFWCWSRMDNDEKIIKNVSISTARVKVDELIAKFNKTFSTQFTFIGNYLKCDSMEKWATKSVYVNSTSASVYFLPCVTSTISVATLEYCNPLNSNGCYWTSQIGL